MVSLIFFIIWQLISTTDLNTHVNENTGIDRNPENGND